MATVNRPPFWVPRPAEDQLWQSIVSYRSSAPLQFLTQQKIFGQGGQVPPFRPNFTYDDPPMWQGSPLNSGAVQVTKTQVKIFGQPGQTPTKRWLPYLTYDDAPMWQGAPLNSGAIMATKTQVKVFGQPGQVPPFRANFTYDDASVWQWPGAVRNRNVLLPLSQPFNNRQRQWLGYDDASCWCGTPIKSAPLQLLTPQKIFGQGGQVVPFRWNATYDDASGWSGVPLDSAPIQLLTPQKVFGQGGQVPPYCWNYTLDDPASWQAIVQRNTNLLSVKQNPFSNRQWQWSDDASGWGGEPINSAVIQLLTAQKIFGAGGQVPPFRPNFTYDDPPSWQWTMAERNPNLLQPSTEPFSNRQTWWYAEDSFWQGSPLSSGAINVTTTQVKIFGQPGQVPPFRANFTYDDASPWQWPLYERNRNVLAPSGQPFSNRQWQWSDDAASWQGTPLLSVTITLTSFSLYKPGVAFPAPPDDYSTWLAEPIGRPNVLQPAAHNPFSNRLAYWFSEDAWWQGKPFASAAIPLLTQVNLFGQGGQVPPFRPNFTYDDASPWQWPLYERNVNVLIPSGEPFNSYKTYWYSEDSFWQGSPVKSPILSFLTQQTVFGQGGQVPPFRWNATYDDPPMWQGAPLNANTIRLPLAEPFSNRQTYWYSEDSWWNAKPVRSAAITLLTQQKVFGQGGQVVPFRWNYTIDDPPMWPGPVPRGSAVMQLPVTGRVLNLYAPFNWAYTFDSPPMWQGVPASFNYLLTQPNPPAKPSGNDWIDFRRRARRR